MAKKDIYFAKESPQMLDAYKKARDTFKYFWREIWWERRRIVPGLNFACVKVLFCQGLDSESLIEEHMWINNIDFDGVSVKGVLINQPQELTNVKTGDTVEVPVCEITDWMFAINGKAYGGFTVQAMRAEMDKKARKQHDKAWGVKFDEPNEIQVAYEQDKHPENLIEHPMCKNMSDSLEDFLTQYPNELTQKDEQGYTMLHREVIAGNKACVDILIQMGADVTAKTNSGYTAADFAKMMSWEHISI